MDRIILSASILSADFTHLGDQIRTAEEAGIDWIHIDVMDGVFVPNITMGAFIVETCRKITSLPIDVHLMITHPERHIHDFAQAGASRLSIHIEDNPNVHRTIQEIRSLGCAPGIVLNPGTSPSSISSLIPFIDLVLVMTVNPGYSGQSFIPGMLQKVAEVKSMLEVNHSQAVIQIDGGVTCDTLPSAYQAGARVFVAATAIFKHPAGIAEGIRQLHASIIK